MRFQAGDRRRQSGFSLIELLIVVTIILVVTAIAVPNIMRARSAYRLRSAAHDQASLVQRLRVEALRGNDTMRIWSSWEWSGSAWTNSFFVDANANCMKDANETIEVRMPTNMFWGWGPSTASMNLDFTPQNTWMPPAFNSRGIPCQYGVVTWTECSTTSGGQPIGFVYFLTDYEQGWGTPSGYAAITVSPAGKVRSWTWSGTTWQ